MCSSFLTPVGLEGLLWEKAGSTMVVGIGVAWGEAMVALPAGQLEKAVGWSKGRGMTEIA